MHLHCQFNFMALGLQTTHDALIRSYIIDNQIFYFDCRPYFRTRISVCFYITISFIICIRRILTIRYFRSFHSFCNIFNNLQTRNLAVNSLH